MGRPRRPLTGGNTAEGLLEAAEHEFAERGFAAARLEDIATRVGLTRPSLLHHFASKELLYQAVIGRVVARLKEALVAGMTTRGTFVERLSATVGRFSDHLYDNPQPTLLLVRELQDAKGQGEQLLREQVLPLLELVETFVRQTGGALLPDALDVRMAILDFVGAVTFFAIAGPIRQALWNTSGDGDRDRQRIREHFMALAHHLFLREPGAASRVRVLR